MSMPGWRSQVSEESRKELITQMYHELSRVTGESDRAKIWNSAAKFELQLFNTCADKAEYTSKLSRKILSLSKKPTGSSITSASGNQTQAPQEGNFQNQSVSFGQPQAISQHGQQFSNSVPFTQQAGIQHPQAAFNNSTSYQSQGTASTSSSSQSVPSHPKQLTPAQLTVIQQQIHIQTQHLLQKEQQFLQQKQSLLQQQQQQLQQQQQQQMLQQQRLTQQRQRMTQEQGIALVQKLQSQQQLARQQMSQQHQLQQQNLAQQQQQSQMQLQQLQRKAQQVRQLQQQQLQQQPLMQSGNQISQQQVQEAHFQQAQQRAQLRAQQQIQIPSTAQKTPASNSTDPKAYLEKMISIRDKYWTDLLTVYREFTKLAQQPKTGANENQQQKVQSFLVNLKRAMSVLNEDATKAQKRTIEDLDKVEHHIITVVLPILKKLRLEQNKRRSSIQQKADDDLEQQAKEERILQTSSDIETPKSMPSGKSTSVVMAIKTTDEHQATPIASVHKKEIEKSTSRPSIDFTVPDTLNDNMKLTPKQYKNFKLTSTQKNKLEAQMLKLQQQQARVSAQQQRAKTPSSQAKFAQTAQKVAQNIAKISQQLAQSKLAMEYEQQQANSSVNEGSVPQKATSIDQEAKEPKLRKTAMSTDGVSPTQRLLTTVKTLEEHRPQSLVAASKKFLTIVDDLGYHLVTNYVI